MRVDIIALIVAILGGIFTLIQDIKGNKRNGVEINNNRQRIDSIKEDTLLIKPSTERIEIDTKRTFEYINENQNNIKKTMKYIENLNKDLEFRNRISKDSAVSNKDLIISSVDKIFLDNVRLKEEINILKVEQENLITSLQIEKEKNAELSKQIKEYKYEEEREY